MFNIHFTIERWKFNKEYNVYVSTQGRFKDKNKKEIFPAPCQGYLVFCFEEKWVFAHRLVLMTWKPVEDTTLTVDHINHNKRDNALSNLCWLPMKQNSKDESLEAFIEGIKAIGAFELANGLRAVPELSHKSRKKIFHPLGLNADGTSKTKAQKKKSKRKPKKNSGLVVVDNEDNGVLFTIEIEGNRAEQLPIGKASQFISAYCGQAASQIKTYLRRAAFERLQVKKKYGALIEFTYTEKANSSYLKQAI